MSYCYCCGAPASVVKTGRVLRFAFCETCKGARFVQEGVVSGTWGWHGKVVSERHFVLECPIHGRQEPIDVENVDWCKANPFWQDTYPVKTRSGRRVMVLNYKVVTP